MPLENSDKIILNAKKIVAINPPIEDFAAYSMWGTPLGLFRVMGKLKKLGKEIKYYDFLNGENAVQEGFVPPKYKKDGRHSYWKKEIEKPEEFSFVPRNFFHFGTSWEKIKNIFEKMERPDLILISSGMTYWYKNVLKIAEIARDIFPDIQIVTGGVAAKLIPDKFTENGISVSEGTFANDSLYVDFEEYIAETSFFPANLIMGCPFKCKYCSSPIFYPKVKYLSIEDQAESSLRLYKSNKISNIAFYDDALLLKNGEYLKKFIKLTSPHFNYHVPNGLHLREIDDELAEMMFHNNFPQLRFGFETIKKGYDVKASTEILFNTLTKLHKVGFTPDRLGIYLLCGLPGQTIEDVEKTIEIVEQAGGRPYLSEFSPVPGTPLFEEHKKESSLDYEKEPMYQNNSIAGWRSSTFTYDVVNMLRNKLSEIYLKQDRK